MTEKTIETSLIDGIARIVMSRPEVRNAFNEDMIAEIHHAVSGYTQDTDVRMIVITGEGTVFSAGADIEWMRKMGNVGFDDNYQDALKLANMLDCIHECSKPTIARVNGPAIGGGTGLVAACDIAIGISSAFFSFSEVKIGLVPACIGPYVIKRVGQSTAGELFITGRRIDADEARQIGLLNYTVDDAEIESKLFDLTESIMGSSPIAIAEAKKLIREVPDQTREQYIDFTARMIAELRTGKEGKEGTAAFLEKRKPSWVKFK